MKEKTKEAVIIAGANGSGKTTLARTYSEKYPFDFINADEWILLYNSEEKFLEIALGSKEKYLVNSEELLESFLFRREE